MARTRPDAPGPGLTGPDRAVARLPRVRGVGEAFAFDFRPRFPTGDLGRAVEQVWYARGTVPYARERIAPTGSTVVVLVLGASIRATPDDGAGTSLLATHGFVVGPHDRPLVNEPTGETHAVGIVTTPVGCRAALGLRPARLRGAVAALEDAWPEGLALRAELLGQADPELGLDTVEDHLRRRLDLSVPALARCELAVDLLEADPTRAVHDVARELVVSAAQLGRDFTRVVGTSPRVLARQLRVRRLLAGIDATTDQPWADLAAALGWYDQAHLIRDFRRHTGVTPTAYLAAQRAWRPEGDTDTAGFVPER